jgi:hypothetical protein
MRRILRGLAIAAVTAAFPALALAGNQEVAEQIARNLRGSGQMSDYKVGVRFQDGTAWLRGRVADEEQMNTALKLVFQTPGVNRVVNELAISASQSEAQTPAASQQTAAGNDPNPLRGQARRQPTGLVKRLEGAFARESGQNADRLASTFSPSAVEPTSAEEPEAPQQMVHPQQARPMARTYRTAMQPGTRGPVAPNGGPMPMYSAAAGGGGVAPARYDQPCMPNYAWPSYAAYPNYAAVTYPKQYSPTAWPYIGPFYPYPQVPLGWRKVTLEWDDGWWFLDFKDQPASCWHR